MGTGLSRTLQQVGASLGVAVLGSNLNNGYRPPLTAQVPALPAAVRPVVEGSEAGAAAVARHLPPPVAAPLLRAAHDAYVQGMAEVALVCGVGTALVGLLVLVFMPARRVRPDDG
jgi:hypothetical protein